MIGHRPTSFLKYAAYIIKSSRQPYTQPSSPVELQCHFRRGGRNLSERFRKLEKTLSGKHDLSQTTIDASQTLAPIAPTTPAPQQRSIVKTFRGLVIPEVPKAPEPDGAFTQFIAINPCSHTLIECCMSGCAICVHDLYQEALDNYNTSVTAVRASLTVMKVPVEEWPKTIRPESQKRTSLPTSSVSLSAFKEMERALKARREAQAQS
jgi:Oxidoreductase-like protein, N-terminal